MNTGPKRRFKNKSPSCNSSFHRKKEIIRAKPNSLAASKKQTVRKGVMENDKHTWRDSDNIPMRMTNVTRLRRVHVVAIYKRETAEGLSSSFIILTKP